MTPQKRFSSRGLGKKIVIKSNLVPFTSTTASHSCKQIFKCNVLNLRNSTLKESTNILEVLQLTKVM